MDYARVQAMLDGQLSTGILYTRQQLFRLQVSRLVLSVGFPCLVTSAVCWVMLPALQVYCVLLLVVVAAIVRDALHLPVDRCGQRRALAPVERSAADRQSPCQCAVADHLQCACEVPVIVKIVDYTSLLVLGLVCDAVFGVVFRLYYESGQDAVNAPASLRNIACCLCGGNA